MSINVGVRRLVRNLNIKKRQAMELRAMAKDIEQDDCGNIRDTLWFTDNETMVDALRRIADELDVAP